MGPLNYDRKTAARHLIRKDQELGLFITALNQYPPLPKREADLFSALSRSIIFQQLSGKAASTIHSRFAALYPQQKPGAEHTLTYTLDNLRAVGLSRNKSLAVLDLAEKISSKALPSRRKLLSMSDTEIISALTAVRGIGPWTVHMYLIFNLGRADVMPAGDLAIRKAYRQLKDLKQTPDEPRLLDLTSHLRPYRSAAAWYLWRLIDGEASW